MLFYWRFYGRQESYLMWMGNLAIKLQTGIHIEAVQGNLQIASYMRVIYGKSIQ